MFKTIAAIAATGLMATTFTACAAVEPDASTPAQAQETTKTKHKKAKKKTDVGRVGKSLTNNGTTYKVTAVEKTQTIGDSFTEKTTSGVFVVIDLELTNNKDETKTFMEANTKLRTADGKAYETSDKALMALGDDSLMMEDIQPDLTTSGKLVYELPASKAHDSQLVIEDLWGHGDVKFDLGL